MRFDSQIKLECLKFVWGPSWDRANYNDFPDLLTAFQRFGKKEYGLIEREQKKEYRIENKKKTFKKEKGRLVRLKRRLLNGVFTRSTKRPANFQQIYSKYTC